MKKATTSGALLALTRTAKWNLDDAHMAHGEATNACEQSQHALTSAQQQLEESHGHFRQMLTGAVLDANMLQYQHFQNLHCQRQVLECEQQLAEREQQAEQTQQQLLDAKVRAETYSRLTQRREQLVERDLMRQQQRIADESGVVRAATANIFLSIIKEKPHGN